ncbi:MAG: hypothetical protein JWN04_3569, partial [Myxococcaceae bacterium]|nr:hypothetical protein [Myxococcaceae bacterium]
AVATVAGHDLDSNLVYEMHRPLL